MSLTITPACDFAGRYAGPAARAGRQPLSPLAPCAGDRADERSQRLFEFAGRYHLFYQWNPLACDHKFKCWGHWSSADLLHWRHEPIALMPDEEYDRNGCYSGSAVESGHAHPVLYRQREI
jgi:hypothetical protein